MPQEPETSVYTYITSPDYISSLEFEYIETYSFQRGEIYDATDGAVSEQYNSSVRTRRLNNRKPTPEEEQEEARLLKQINSFQSLIYENGKLHHTAIKTGTFSKDHVQSKRLKEILQTEVADRPGWICGTFYRDAIIFYDAEHNILSALNVCLSCDYMETQELEDISADEKTYKLLTDFFIDLGHTVELK